MQANISAIFLLSNLREGKKGIKDQRSENRKTLRDQGNHQRIHNED